jgi:ketol-acid reductoisomerase
MATFYSESDADLSVLDGKTIAIIGYGNQGHAHAQNLRDSGVSVIVGQRPGASFDQAAADGFEPMPAADAARQGDIVMLMLPDESMGEVYDAEIAAALQPGNALAFCHGFNVRFGFITPPENVDVIMVSPKGPGRHVRSEFVAGRGLAGLIAVEQDTTGNALQIALAYAKAIGCLRACGIKTTFGEECESDLFGEQAVLCGGVSAMIKAAFDTLVESGYQPEVAYFEVMHELALIVELLAEGGLTHMRRKISNTAEYGDLTRGPRVIEEGVRAEMRNILSEIQSGDFAREWIAEYKAGLPVFRKLAKDDEGLLLEKVGSELRKKMKGESSGAGD